MRKLDMQQVPSQSGDNPGQPTPGPTAPPPPIVDPTQEPPAPAGDPDVVDPTIDPEPPMVAGRPNFSGT